MNRFFVEKLVMASILGILVIGLGFFLAWSLQVMVTASWSPLELNPPNVVILGKLQTIIRLFGVMLGLLTGIKTMRLNEDKVTV